MDVVTENSTDKNAEQESAVMDSAKSPTPAKPANKESVSVKSYQDQIWISSWKRRSAGLWAGTLCGAGYGAAIGALACLSTILVGMTGGAALSLIPVIVPAMMVVGIGSGIAVFTGVGAPSGAVAHGLKEQDKRWAESGLVDTKDKDDDEKGKKFFNWKIAVAGFVMAGLVGAVFIASGGLAGIFATGAASSISAAIGTAVGLPGVTASAAAVTNCLVLSVFGLFGAQFGFNGPKISLDATNLMGKFLSGKIFEGEKASPSPALEVAPDKKVSQFKTPKMGIDVGFESNKGIKTLVAPVGQYAGKDGGMHTRRLAQQQFNAMDTRNTLPH
jgi:hypothetical protein